MANMKYENWQWQSMERMNSEFKDKVVLVTGGCRNTGLEIADRFLREGAEVFVCGSNDESVARGREALAARGHTKFHVIKCDVGQKESVAAMLDEVERTAGRMDVLVSNAANFGIGHGETLDMTEEMLFEVLNVNVGGTFRVVQGVAKRFFMRQERDAYTNQRGVVVCVGSNTSERVSRKRLAYCTSKGGLDSMVRSFATDFGPLGIRINMVAPGYIRTDRWEWLSEEVKAKRRSNTLTGMEADGQDVAAAVLFLASSGARAFQGARIVQDSGSSVQLYPESCEDDTSTMKMR